MPKKSAWFRIRVDADGIEAMEKVRDYLSLFPKLADRVQVRTATKVAQQGKVYLARLLGDRLNLPSAYIKSEIAVAKAFEGWDGGLLGRKLYAELLVRGDAIALYKYGALPKQPPRQVGLPIPGRKRASVLVSKITGRTVLRHAFLARFRSGHIGIFERDGVFDMRNTTKEVYRDFSRSYLDAAGRLQGRLKTRRVGGVLKEGIKELWGPRFTDYFQDDGQIYARFMDYIQERLETVFKQEFDYAVLHEAKA